MTKSKYVTREEYKSSEFFNWIIVLGLFLLVIGIILNFSIPSGTWECSEYDYVKHYDSTNNDVQCESAGCAIKTDYDPINITCEEISAQGYCNETHCNLNGQLHRIDSVCTLYSWYEPLCKTEVLTREVIK